MPNPYPSNFTNLIEPGDIALDLGGGGRTLEGVISVDLIGGDVIGDCLQLPFRDDSVNLILSQAVLEHVTNPQQAVDEMFRVLMPYGALYVEAAFMQPIHMAPNHYFNITPYGLRHLLREWDIEWTAPVGTPQETIDWITNTYGEQSRRSRGYGLRAVSSALYAQASCGVSALARKPV